MGVNLVGFREIDPPADISAATLRSDRFRLQREVDWQRLELIVEALEKNRLGRIADDDLLELPVLYRKAASSLAVARETSLDAATLSYLESLVRRAWFQVYGPRTGLFAWMRHFLLGGWSASVRDIWLDICIALFVMVAGTAVGWLLVASDREWYFSLVSADMAGGRQPGATAEELAETLQGTEGAEGLTVFAAYLFSNNSGVCILAFALGFCFGIPTMLLLVYNMTLLGAMLWLFFDAGLGWDFVGWLSVHGTTELFAILLSGAAGMHIGRSMVVVAGILEGYARQLVGTTMGRYTIGGVMLFFWVCYFAFAPRPRDHDGEAPS